MVNTGLIDYLNPLAQYGRNEDRFMAHVAPGEMVVPPVISDYTRSMLLSDMLASGLDPAEFTVGDGMKINPVTGQPEFFFKKLFRPIRKLVKKIIPREIRPALRIAAPIAGILAPGIGTALGTALGAGAAAAPIVGGAALGAGLSTLGGADWEKAALSGLAGGLGGGGASQVLSGSGLSGASLGAAKGALTGAAGGAALGGSEGALSGAALGGIGGALTSGAKIPVLGQASTTGPGSMGPATAGSGVLGTVTRTANMGGGASLFGGASGTGGGGMSPLGLAATLGGALQSSGASSEMEEELLRAQQSATRQLAPYQQTGGQAFADAYGSISSGFNPDDLASDPGYQFQLEQGQKALDQSLAAQGLSQSGAAIKAAQDYAQGLASTQYQNAYDDWLARNQQLMGLGDYGYGAAGSGANIQANLGAIQAANTANQSDLFNRTLAQVLSGRGML